jgi:hypothetical protein
MPFRVTAYMCVFNEADIVGWTIQHLIVQGVRVHVLDNWSIDDSAKIALSFHRNWVSYERWPADGPSRHYEWAAMLRRVEVLAMESGSDWCSLNDADEIRRSPRPDETLLQACLRAEAEGYNAFNHQAYHFLPTDDLYRGDPENHFRRYLIDTPDRSPTRQVKTWKNTGQRVDLASSGGHYSSFPGLNIHPEKLILKHYPLRTSAQAARKVLQERVGRYSPEERSRGWHVQYDYLAKSQDWIKDPASLTLWEEPCPTKV